jgi:phenylalanyl-tRNA synthetase alpha subunit
MIKQPHKTKIVQLRSQIKQLQKRTFQKSKPSEWKIMIKNHNFSTNNLSKTHKVQFRILMRSYALWYSDYSSSEFHQCKPDHIHRECGTHQVSEIHLHCPGIKVYHFSLEWYTCFILQNPVDFVWSRTNVR